jgi:hypothetical protein
MRSALRSTPCDCYKSGMGTKGLRDRATGCPSAAYRRCAGALVMMTFAVSALAACSSASSPSVQASGAVPAPPADDGAAYYPVPKQSLGDALREMSSPAPSGSASAAPAPAAASAMPHPPSAYTPSGQPYVPNQQAYGAPPGAAPPPAATADAEPPPPTAGVYPQQTLGDFFKNGAR